LNLRLSNQLIKTINGLEILVIALLPFISPGSFEILKNSDYNWNVSELLLLIIGMLSAFHTLYKYWVSNELENNQDYLYKSIEGLSYLNGKLLSKTTILNLPTEEDYKSLLIEYLETICKITKLVIEGHNSKTGINCNLMIYLPVSNQHNSEAKFVFSGRNISTFEGILYEYVQCSSTISSQRLKIVLPFDHPHNGIQLPGAPASLATFKPQIIRNTIKIINNYGIDLPTWEIIKQYFKDHYDDFKSFISIPIFLVENNQKIKLGVLNINSPMANYFDDTSTKDLANSTLPMVINIRYVLSGLLNKFGSQI
jgi:hypothetical protein